MRLLVSVTDAEEAGAVVAGGADIVDVKNPREGVLGAQPPGVVRAVREAVPARIPVSVALGDLPDLPGTAALAALGAAVLGVQYVKVGLAASRTVAAAEALLREICRAVRSRADAPRVVAVGFADGPARGLLDADDLVSAAISAGIEGCMLDTFDKRPGCGLLEFLSDSVLGRFVARAHAAGLEVGLAGSLRFTDLPRVAAFGADVVGVRSAACEGGRTGTVSRDRVADLKRTLAAISPAFPSAFRRG
ncbi:MAG TPA: (5-formylfuran-3-yl)methyl phosphate synthase [bacterium]|nr:(5-formylfuran-3-yl)methyl phosphate synthase [bacterium]